MQTLLKILKAIINILFPQTCAGCNKNNTTLCMKCIDGIPRAKAPEYSFITSVYSYQNPIIKNVIWKLKYKNNRSVAKSFGEKLYEELLESLSDNIFISKHESFLLIPIPLHKKRLLERGYNQSELLAQEIFKYAKKEISEEIFETATKALVRTRATNTQTKKESCSKRFENLRGAFNANPEIVRGRNIILIDDVTTTGATLKEARKTLIRAGARTVQALTIAH